MSVAKLTGTVHASLVKQSQACDFTHLTQFSAKSVTRTFDLAISHLFSQNPSRRTWFCTFCTVTTPAGLKQAGEPLFVFETQVKKERKEQWAVLPLASIIIGDSIIRKGKGVGMVDGMERGMGPVARGSGPPPWDSNKERMRV